MASSAKLTEAKKLLAQAQKSEKTSMFKWNPDWESASMYYDQAALAFKVAKDYGAAKDAYMSASNAHEQFGTMFHAAKALEGAATCCMTLKREQESVELIKRATGFYRLHGAIDEACNSMEKAAAQSEKQKMFQHAAQLLMEVASLRRDDDRGRRAKKPLLKALQNCLKAKDYAKALEVVEMQSEIAIELDNADQYAKALLSGVCVSLMQGDFVAAERRYLDGVAKMPKTSGSEESVLADGMLTAFDQGDDEALDKLKSNQMFGFIDNQLALDVRKIKIPSGPAPSKQRAADDALVVKRPEPAAAPPVAAAAAAPAPVAEPEPVKEPATPPAAAPEPTPAPAAVEAEAPHDPPADPGTAEATPDSQAVPEEDEEDDEDDLC